MLHSMYQGVLAVPELSSLLCILLVVLGVVTLVGHAIWIVVAHIIRSITTPEPSAPIQASPADDELRDIAATHRKLRRLMANGSLDPATIHELENKLIQRRRELVRGEAVAAKPPEQEARPTPAPTVPAEAILDALPAAMPAPA